MKHRLQTLASVSSLLLLLTWPLSALADPLVNVRCGAKGDRPCTVADAGWWQGGLRADGCDRGLDSKLEWCQGKYLPYPCYRCRAFTRQTSTRVDGIQTSFSAGALQEQRKLAAGEPLNWVTQIGTHNAYNVLGDGYVTNPNQVFSISDQLDMGSRVLYLDVHNLATGNKLGHGQDMDLFAICGDPHCGTALTDRHSVMGLREIRDWLNANPGQIVTIRFETYLDACLAGVCIGDEDAHNEFRDGIRNQLGQWLLRTNEKPADRWPTPSELIAMNRRVIVFGDELTADFSFGGYSDMRKAKEDVTDFCGESWNPDQDFTGVEEDSLRFFFGIAYDGGKYTGCLCPGSEPCNKRQNDGWLEAACQEVRYIRDVAACNVSTISLDQLGGTVWASGIANPAEATAVFDDMVWSWRKEANSSAYGWKQNGKSAALAGRDGRWEARDPTEERRYACGHPRDGDPSQWLDFIAGRGPRTEWRVTDQAGPWGGGGQACQEEFGPDFVFSVPVNAAQNQQLRLQIQDRAPDVWLAYRDVDSGPGVNWQIDRAPYVPSIRHRPRVALEGQMIEFESDWSSQCAGGRTGAWVFGDGSAVLSTAGEVSATPGMTRFSASHVFADNGVYQVTHGVPECGPAQHTLSLPVANAPPRLRVDCSPWEACSDEESSVELQYFVDEMVQLAAAIHDPGILDTHVATVEWGDGTHGPMNTAYDNPGESGRSATLSADHRYSGCGAFAITVEAVDDDGGADTKEVSLQIDDPPPQISCPANVVAQATSKSGAVVNLGQPVVTGGVCEGIDLSNDGIAGGLYPIGTTPVTWSATNHDERFDSETNAFVHLKATCVQQVTVRDTTPPRIESISASPSVLWPPNKALQRVRISVVVKDAVDPAPVCRILDVQVYETASPGKGDDVLWKIVDALELDLMAWREGGGAGRTYAATVECSDFSGNASLGQVEILVPHDQRK